MDLRQALEVVNRTGKLLVGYRQTIKLVAEKRPVMVIASRKADTNLLKTVSMMAAASGIPLLLTDFSPAELGLSLRKPFPASFISILDAGSSDLLEQVRSERSE
ncbi:MAG: ribosomal L7Ae/L30e/S12e/Gadd45 family protein [Candidatus Caldarchaeum sp.]